MFKRFLIVVLIVIVGVSLYAYNRYTFRQSTIVHTTTEEEVHEMNIIGWEGEVTEYVTCDYEDNIKLMISYIPKPSALSTFPNFDKKFYDKDTFEIVEVHQDVDEMILSDEFNFMRKSLQETLALDVKDPNINNYNIEAFNSCFDQMDLSPYKPYIKE